MVTTSSDYRLRRMAAEALAASGPEGGVRAIAVLGPAASEEEHERVISVVDALGLAGGIAEDAIVAAINHTSEGVRRAAVAVAYRMPSSSALGIIQRAIYEGGALGALRALGAIGELTLVEAIPIVQRQIVETQDAAVIQAAVRALGRMAKHPDCPALRAVRLLERAMERLPDLPDTEAAERAALATLWALGQFELPEATEAVETAKSYPSVKVGAFASKMLERAKKPGRTGG
ncbi:MAG: HEAT repeat domain-containing protein [Planctomycetota bacterium]